VSFCLQDKMALSIFDVVFIFKLYKKRERMVFMKKQIEKMSGITLIALVITIIVLLILAAISISMLSGDNNILSRAGEARDITGEKSIAEKVYLAYQAALINGQGKVTEPLLKAELDKEFKNYSLASDLSGVTIDGKGYNFDGTISKVSIDLKMTHEDVTPTAGGNVASVNEENIPIPTGFYAVAGTSKNSGFVISSESGDDLNNTKGGNQFVWVPVDQNQKLSLKVNSEENITTIKLKDPFGDVILEVTESIGKTYTNENIEPTVNGLYQAEVTTAEVTTTNTLVVRSLYAKDRFNDYLYTEEYAKFEGYDSLLAMTQYWGYDSVDDWIAEDNEYIGGCAETENYTNSVNTYGGFYVGRFEAGVTTKRTTGNTSTTVADLITASGLPLSQKEKDSYTYVTRSQAKGLADKMYEGKSHLLTGAAWDRTIDWLVNTNNKTLGQIAGDSTTWGNYYNDNFSGTTGIAKTGVFSQTNANNIYDLAGNAWEWTSEKSPRSVRPCVTRGGGYFSVDVCDLTASRRNYYNESWLRQRLSVSVLHFSCSIES